MSATQKLSRSQDLAQKVALVYSRRAQLAREQFAKNVAEAHEFINYMMKPEVAAKNSNFIGYPNGNLASQQFLDKEVKDDPSVYPPPETMAKLYTLRAHDAAAKRTMNRLWTRVKTGR